MAEIKLNNPVAEIHGALSKRSNIVNRQKKQRLVKANNTPNSLPSSVPCSTTNSK
jgi:hypothetical protein